MPTGTTETAGSSAAGAAGPVAASAERRALLKQLPEHAREHNRSLVLQTLYREAGLSRADVARATGLTRVTVSDLVAELIAEGYVIELGPRDEARPGKPATVLDIHRSGHRIVGLDLSDAAAFRGAVLDLDGEILERAEVTLAGATGDAATAKVIELAERLLAGSALPVLGIGVGSPGVVDDAGVVLTAPNLGWQHEPLQLLLAQATGHPVLVANDANVAARAEYGFGGAAGDLMVVRVGHGVGAGLLIDGAPVRGARFAAGEIGHVVVGTDGGLPCVCGKEGCLETWLAAPRLDAALAGAAGPTARDAVLDEAGRRLGIALAPVIGALDLAEVVLSGPALLDGRLLEAAAATLRERTMAGFHGDVRVRMSSLGEDVIMRGAAAMVLSGRLGVS
ncbi:MAG: ROK family transcriptional regulator [Actinomycetales bacterium]|nr:ROK family transcriptional regulator [Actinomycetales bacterium]